MSNSTGVEMRPIKFRAWENPMPESWCKERGITFVPDFKGQMLDVNHWTINMLGSTEGYKTMQFTGLYDKNGKEIWEGDIVRNEHGTVCAVVWKEDECGFIATKPYDGYPNCYTYDFSLYPGLHEVLGNIYSDPHLLENK